MVCIYIRGNHLFYHHLEQPRTRHAAVGHSAVAEALADAVAFAIAGKFGKS